MKKDVKLLLIVAASCTMMFSSCSNKDVYDNSEADRIAAEKTLGVEIGANQTWETMTLINANISVNEELDTYTIKIYKTVPIGNSSAGLMAKATIENGNTWNGVFDAAIADSTLFVVRVDSKGRREMIPATVVNGTITADFNNSSASAKTRSGGDDLGTFDDPSFAAVQSVPYTSSQISAILATATEVKTSGVTGTNSSHYYKITGSDNYNVAGINDANPVIVVSGTWNTGYVDISKTSEIIVANGGKINLGNNFTINSPSKIVVMDGGIITGTSTYKLTFQYGGSLYNAGNMSNLSLHFTNGGTCYNAGTISSVTSRFNYAYLVNRGIFTSENLESHVYAIFNADGAKLDITNNNTSPVFTDFYNRSSNCKLSGKISINKFYNSCKVIVAGSFTPSWTYLSKGSSVECTDLNLSGAVMQLGGNSIFKVDGTTTPISSGFTATGTSESGIYAIFDMNNVGGSSSKAKYDGHIYAQRKTTWKGTETLNNGAAIVPNEEARYTIPGSDCSIGFTLKAKGDDGVDTAQLYTYSFEDLKSGDYDMNDVVMYITPPIDHKVNITVKAGGAYLEDLIGLHDVKNNVDSLLFNGKEIHEIFGIYNYNPTINTKDPLGGVSRPDVKLVLTVPDNFTLTESGDFYIISPSEGKLHIPEFTPGFKPGDAFYAIRIPIDWWWPIEYIAVPKAYPYFCDWAKDPINSKLDWYNYYIPKWVCMPDKSYSESGYLYKRGSDTPLK